MYEVTSATEAAETRIPVLYLSISAGTALTKACFGFGSAFSGAQRCTVLLAMILRPNYFRSHNVDDVDSRHCHRRPRCLPCRQPHA